MGKRLRTTKSISSCKSPRSRYYSSPISSPPFNCYEHDIWTYIARFMDGKTLLMLAATSKWFNAVIMQESIWKFLCLSELRVPAPPSNVAFSWIKLYASLSDGSHSYLFRQKDKHIDWMRVGAFFLDYPAVILTDHLQGPIVIREGESAEKMIETGGACVLTNIKTGIWIADLQLVHCPVCGQTDCDGTMQTLDVRHIELFLCEGYLNGTWDYEQLGTHKILNAIAASGAIFSVRHLKDPSTTNILNLKSWVRKPDDGRPSAVANSYSVAVYTNLPETSGITAMCHIMKAGVDGEVVSIRLSQQIQ
ncbi:hypothetical protein ACFE04_026521 [Oxalis oulophora]